MTNTKQPRIHKRELISPGDLKTDPLNPNKMSEKELKSLEYSIQKWGDVHPVVIDQHNVIADGEHRVMAYLREGIEQIEVIRYNFKDDDERKLFRQTMNKLRGEHDKKMDIDEVFMLVHQNDENLQEYIRLTAQEDDQAVLQYLSKQHPEYSLPGKGPEDQDKLDKLMQEQMAKADAETVTQPGDIWKLGNHLLMCGDCTKQDDVLTLLKQRTVDMLLTDPPYGVNYSGKNEFLNLYDKGNKDQTPIQGDDDEIEDYLLFFTDSLKYIPFSDYNTCYIFMGGFALHKLRLAMDQADITWGDYLIWLKNNHVLGRKDYNARHEFVVYGWKERHRFYGGFSDTILEFDKPHSSHLHPTMKPVDLLCKLIQDGSLPSMIIYDPFIGSGSTLIASEMMDRACYGMEISPRYCDVAIKRWMDYTKKAPTRLKDNKKWEDLQPNTQTAVPSDGETQEKDEDKEDGI